MGLKLLSEHLNGLKLFKPDVFKDDRGFFIESYRKDDLLNYGIDVDFVQDNHSGSVKDTLRGMHFQYDKPQGKLIRVTKGEAIFVEVDIRITSDHFSKYEKFNLSSDNNHILWVPPGFANGFLTISDWCEVQYKCSAIYNPKGESGIRWDSPKIEIKWDCDNPLLSNKDSNAQSLSEWMETEIAQSQWYKS